MVDFECDIMYHVLPGCSQFFTPFQWLTASPLPPAIKPELGSLLEGWWESEAVRGNPGEQ